MSTVYNVLNQPLAMLKDKQIVNLSGQVLANIGNNHLERDGTVLVCWDGDKILTRDGALFGKLCGREVQNMSRQTLATVSDDCTEPIALAAAFMFFFVMTN